MPRYLRRYARRDSNESSLIETAHQLGATWLSLSLHNAPDAVIGYRGKDYLVEVKTPKGKHKPGQKTFAETWRGTVHVVRTPADVAQLLAGEGGQ